MAGLCDPTCFSGHCTVRVDNNLHPVLQSEGAYIRRRTRMRFLFQVFVTISIFLVVGLLGYQTLPVRAQEATSTLAPTRTPVPTATMGGPHVYVPERVNVRTGPDTTYEQIGVLVSGQTAPAVGRTALGEWIAIEYPGVPDNRAWVYAQLVVVRDATLDDLARVDLPPTPTRPPAATLLPIPGLGGKSTTAPTRLPTFTPAPPVAVPTFDAPGVVGSSFPPILGILGLFVLGILAGVLAVLQQRS